MKFNKPPVAIASLLTVGTIVTGIGTAALASAESTATTSTSSIAKTNKHEKRQDHQIRLTARLNQAVTDGTISTTQKTAFKAELQALKTERKAALSKASTPTERQSERAKLKTELQTWATSNNFPLSKIAPKMMD